MIETLQRGPSALSLPLGGSLAGTRITSALSSGEERRALEAVAGPARAVKANTDLVREGEVADQLYIITDGWACRYKTTRDGARQIVGLAVSGDVANRDTLMVERPGYGVRMLSVGKIAALSRDRALALAEQRPGIARTLIRLALTQNAILNQWALGLGRQSAFQRLAHLFCELAVRVAGDEPDTSSFDLPLTQEQLADVLGLTSVHVNRTMQQLRSEGLIASAGRTLTLPDVSRLRRIGEFDPAYLRLEAMDARRDRLGDEGRSRRRDAMR